MAVRNDFSSGEVLTAADLNDTFASKVDYALPTNAQTGTAYTFVAADAEKLTTASNGSAVTLTIPPASSVAWPDNTVLRVVNYGAGAVTIDGGSGVTVTNTASTISQYGAAVAIRTGSDAWTVVPFGGGDVPEAVVSSPAATGQYTDGSGDTWDYYSFTTSGTLVVDTGGTLDVLCVGGGGGCTTSTGAGGGGEFIRVNRLYVDAGSITVTVGAGGSAGSAGNESSLGTLVVAGKGGRGLSGSGSDIHAYSSGATGGGVGGFTTSGNSANGNGGFGSITDDITGSSVGYAPGAVTGATSADKGAGAGPRGTNASGREGIVIVRVKV